MTVRLDMNWERFTRISNHLKLPGILGICVQYVSNAQYSTDLEMERKKMKKIHLLIPKIIELEITIRFMIYLNSDCTHLNSISFL